MALVAGLLLMVANYGLYHVVAPSCVVAIWFYLFSQVSHINALSFESPKVSKSFEASMPTFLSCSSSAVALDLLRFLRCYCSCFFFLAHGRVGASLQALCFFLLLIFSPGRSQTKEWSDAQVTATQGDYSYESIFWNKISNGLNNQSFHHIFPGVHSCHYPRLSKRLRPIFEKYHLPLGRPCFFAVAFYCRVECLSCLGVFNLRFPGGWSHSYLDVFAMHVEHIKQING